MERLPLILSILALIMTFTTYKFFALLVIAIAIYMVYKDIKNKKNYKAAAGTILVSIIAFVVVFSNGPTIELGKNSNVATTTTSSSTSTTTKKDDSKKEKEEQKLIGDPEKVVITQEAILENGRIIINIENKNKNDVYIPSLTATIRDKKTSEFIGTASLHSTSNLVVPGKSSIKTSVASSKLDSSKEYEIKFETELANSKVNDVEQYVKSGIELDTSKDDENKKVTIAINNKSKLEVSNLFVNTIFYKDGKAVAIETAHTESQDIIPINGKDGLVINYPKTNDGNTVEFDKIESYLLVAQNFDTTINSNPELGIYKKDSDEAKAYKKISFKQIQTLENGDVIYEIKNDNSDEILVMTSGIIVRDAKSNQYIDYISSKETQITIAGKSSVYSVISHRSNPKATDGSNYDFDSKDLNIEYVANINLNKENTYKYATSSKINLKSEHDAEAKNIAITVENNTKTKIYNMNVLSVFYKDNTIVGYTITTSNSNDIVDSGEKTLVRASYPKDKDYKDIEDFTTCTSYLIHAKISE